LPAAQRPPEVWGKLMGFPEAVPRHWFACAKDHIVESDEGVCGACSA